MMVPGAVLPLAISPLCSSEPASIANDTNSKCPTIILLSDARFRQSKGLAKITFICTSHATESDQGRTLYKTIYA